MRPTPAFLLSLLVAIVLIWLFSPWREPLPFTYTIFFLALLYFLLMFLQLIFAVPLRWYLARKGWRSMWIDGVLGGVGTGLPATIYVVLERTGHGTAVIEIHNTAAAVMSSTVLGVVIGLSYGLMRLRDRRVRAHPTAADIAARFD